MIYQRKIQITSSLVDFRTELSPFSVVQVFEDSMTNLFQMIGIDGITVKAKYGAIWLVTKTAVRFLKPARWGEWVDVSCKLIGKTPITTLTELVLKDENGSLLAVGHMEMCPFSPEKKRVLRVSAVGLTENEEIYSSEMDIPFERFTLENGIPADTVRVRSTNLDMSIHTNNKEYIRFCLGTYPYEQLQKQEISAFEVHYIGQSFQNDILQVLKEEQPGKDLLSIRCREEEIFSMKIDWSKE